MIITRTPFRVTLGGGGTDLPAYYERHGGLIIAAGIAKYMYINVNQPFDRMVRVKYSESETVKTVTEVRHNIAREALKINGFQRGIEVASIADIPAGTGLGSSSCYTVGLLNALHTLKMEYMDLYRLAEEACRLEIDILGYPIGKQDQYMAAFGGITVLEIDRTGQVEVKKLHLDPDLIENLNRNLMMFFTHTFHRANDILAEQSSSARAARPEVLSNMHRIKEIGYLVLAALEEGNLTEIGRLFDEHWRCKRAISPKMSNPRFDEIYESALEAGALGGKISGAGGGGFFVFYVEQDHAKFREKMAARGLRPMRYRFDFEGTKVLANLRDICI
ncbi:MAG TPA: galactokinase [bacterium]|nr:galactokinase [bacterium]HPJ72123.1 galactokinase [bacterium]HPQ65183.1 galactokinase [bacterium]